MAGSRRRFFSTTTTIAAATATPLLESQAAPAAIASALPAPAPAAALPALAVIALNRMGYGPQPGDIAGFNALGASDDERLAAYVEQQLTPSDASDTICNQKLAAARLKIRYSAASDGSYPAKAEARPLTALGKQTAELWPLADFSKLKTDFAERIRPLDEVRVATWIRAVYSKWQLREVLVDFWHNHFNVNGPGESQIYTTFPVYDRDVIRKNCLGNFRVFLEDVAKSTAMMYYLDNYNNKVAGGEGGNENYARELFELHTLGSDNYLKFYDDRSQIGTISYGGKQYARGYIDDDIYEAASCLGGWSIDANTGQYEFKDAYHYHGIKEVLGTLIRTIDFATPEDEARRVFDLLAGHPKVAENVCRKLVRRLIADEPPQAVVDAAVAAWMANLDQPDQIKQIVRVILNSNEFKTTWGQKVKRPFDAIISYLRAMNAQLPVDTFNPAAPNDGGFWGGIFYQIGGTGHKLFEWPTPTGYPDVASYWTSTNSTLRRWNLPFILTQSWGGNIQIPDLVDPSITGSCVQIVDSWIARLCGFAIDTGVRAELIAFMAQGRDPNLPPAPTPKAPDYGDVKGVKDRVRALVQLLAASPDFHAR